ncbi:site-specific integrase [Enterococcus thailandicus]|uniref:site-specific integrase n=1 Tax=Enterococcus TaxID=1350 RepID=UPI0022EBB3BE|nr:site-specific integrase [Enterococcus thailandicus]MDA3964181.1 tyrosine-type recombinase/integrase [Enterococcus thailandicus]
MATFKQYEKKDGTKLWQFQTYLGTNPLTGRPIKTTRRNFKTKKEAQLALSRLKLEFETNNGLKKEVNDTFTDVYILWYENYRKTVKESTSIATERYIKIHVLPLLGNYKIKKITPKMAQESVNIWAKKLQVYRIVLQYTSKIFDYAINLELIDKNPFSKVIRPKIKKTRPEKEIKFYTSEQVGFILNYLEKKVTQVNNSNFLYKYFAEWDLTLYRILAFTGVRGGEALALLWDDINFYERTLDINKTLSQTRTGYAVLPPKTKKSNRIISLDSKTIKILKKWQLHQKEYLFQNGTVNNNIIFSNFEGKYSNRQSLYMRSSRIAEFTHMPNIGTHGWRHTHASMLYEAGIPMREAQERLGHSSLEMTNSIYTHLNEKQKNGTAEKLAKFANF